MDRWLQAKRPPCQDLPALHRTGRDPAPTETPSQQKVALSQYLSPQMQEHWQARNGAQPPRTWCPTWPAWNLRQRNIQQKRLGTSSTLLSMPPLQRPGRSGACTEMSKKTFVTPCAAPASSMPANTSELKTCAWISRNPFHHARG